VGAIARRRARRGRAPDDVIDPFAVPPHHFPQIWLLFVTLAALGLAVLHGERLLGPVFALDRSHLTALIGALVVAGSVHAVWHVVRFSRRIEIARAALDGRHPSSAPIDDTDTAFVAAWIRDVEPVRRSTPTGATAVPGDASGASCEAARESARQVRPEIPTAGPPGPLDRSPSGSAAVGAHGESAIADSPATGGAVPEDLFELYADRLRSPVDFGWFLVDMSVRLGLLGTIIGFILIFGSLSGVSIDGAEGLRDLLVAMSGGMGTALFTTLAGLVGATLLSVQYLILGREAEHLLGLLARYRAEAGRRTGRTAHAAASDRARAVLALDRRAGGG